MRQACTVALTLLALCACQTERPFAVQEATVVDAAGTTVARTIGNPIGGGFELNLERTDPVQGRPQLALLVEHEAHRPFEIEAGQSLLAYLGGRVEIFSTPAGSRDDRELLRNGRIRERARFPITDAELFALLGADSVELELHGRWGKRRFPLRPEARANLQAFVDAELR
ncbi:MAG: hypothetical protein AAFZ65_11490 [Planctomycetota bacterium]